LRIPAWLVFLFVLDLSHRPLSLDFTLQMLRTTRLSFYRPPAHSRVGVMRCSGCPSLFTYLKRTEHSIRDFDVPLGFASEDKPEP
jgi:hypothetical protein